MQIRVLIIIFVLLTEICSSQNLNLYDPVKAEPAGGPAQLDQLIQTQLELPKNILAKDYHENITMYFLLDTTGSPVKISFDKTNYDRAVTRELRRITSLLKFRKVFPDPLLPYFITYPISADKYKHYYKQKNKFKIISPFAADTSQIVYKKADKAALYYKNADEGLTQFLLEELEYPKMAFEKSVEGTVIVEFIVETNGFVTSVIPLQKVAMSCTEEAVRLLKQTRWQPAELNNKLVRYKMTYPITFSLRNQKAAYSAGTIGQ